MHRSTRELACARAPEAPPNHGTVCWQDLTLTAAFVEVDGEGGSLNGLAFLSDAIHGCASRLLEVPQSIPPLLHRRR